MARIGYSDPQSWMPACNATYKTGILFENWFEKGDSYWHAQGVQIRREGADLVIEIAPPVVDQLKEGGRVQYVTQYR